MFVLIIISLQIHKTNQHFQNTIFNDFKIKNWISTPYYINLHESREFSAGYLFPINLNSFCNASLVQIKS